MSGTAIRRERIGDVLNFTLDNPRRDLNFVDAAFHHELTRLFAELRTERDARAILLTSRPCSGTV